MTGDAVFADPTGRRLRIVRRSLRVLAVLVVLGVGAVVLSLTSGVRLPVLAPPIALPRQDRPAPAHSAPPLAQRGTTTAATPGSTPRAPGPALIGVRGTTPAANSAAAGTSAAARSTPNVQTTTPAGPPSATPTPPSPSPPGRPTGTTHGNAPSTPPGKTKSHP